jgi:hypothetical protein
MTTKLVHKTYEKLTLILCSDCWEWAKTTMKPYDYHTFFSQLECEACEAEERKEN